MANARKAILSTKELAECLGLSRTTVSRAINGHPSVKPETRQLVEDAMRETGFVPNLYARGLRGARSNAYGIVFQMLDIPVLIEKVQLLERAFRQIDYRPIVELVDEGEQRCIEAAQYFITAKVDGVFWVGPLVNAAVKQAAKKLRDAGVAVIMIDPNIWQPYNCVALDRRESLEKVTLHLLEQGHRQFCLFDLTPENPTIS